MKQLIYTLLIVIGATLTSCMQNGGNIGYLYGQWRLEEVTHDNTTSVCDTVFFSFQSDVFQTITRCLWDYTNTATITSNSTYTTTTAKKSSAKKTNKPCS